MAAASTFAQSRLETTLSEGWQFSQDRETWKTVSVPHDWAIAGPFDKKWDLQKVRIEQNGEKEATEKSGRSGALPWIGEGHYKRIISIPDDCQHAELVFDGAMAEPTVSLNGKKVGYWAYGYNTFRVDLTPAMKPGDNLLEVDLQNVEESSRWYPGAGIYRPVKLIMTGEDWIDPWKTFIRTTDLSDGKATLQMTVGCGNTNDDYQAFEVELRDAKGKLVGHEHIEANDNGKDTELAFTISNPNLWTPETPYLYTAHIKYMQNGETLDEVCQKFGIRTISVSKEGGFQLNGVTRKIKGVCLHHDLGPLGAAINKAALIRQIKTMKEMGCDAIRTSHNMPSQMQMDICDSLGMMVMAESFDMWIYPKCKNGYARFFKEWSDRDMTNLVLANRNHPSIVMWSIGNEIPEQWSEEGREIACHLQDICHRLDPTRPVTQGMDRAEDALKSGFAQVMDVPGFNYRVHKYDNNIKQLPQGFLLGSETTPHGRLTTTRKPSRRPMDNVHPTTQNTVRGAICPTTTGCGRMTRTGSSESSCGRDMTISASLRLMMSTGPRARATSASATSQDCPRTATTSIVHTGIKTHTPSTCCRTGAGAAARKTRAIASDR